MTTAQEQQEPWDEAEKYEAALAHLEELQERIHALRSTIPSVIAPLTQPNKGNATMFAGVGQSAVQATDGLRQFREAWNSEQTQEIFARSKASWEKERDLSRAAEVRQFGWSTSHE